MEKDHQSDSMATVQMKPDYPPSEVYSSSEPPPAYRNKTATSIQIARIVAVTIVISSFVLGAFILASSYVTARAGCQQLDQLDAMLDKELILESRDIQGAMPYFTHQEQEQISGPVAHALHQAPPTPPPPPTLVQAEVMGHPEYNQPKAEVQEEEIDENKLQTLTEEKPSPASTESDDTSSSQEDESGDDSRNGADSSSESEEADDVNIPFNIKLPLQRDLDDVARALLMNSNLRSRMGCVVERHRAEEFGLPSMGPLAALLGGMDPRRRTTGERIAIICESGDEPRHTNEPRHPQVVVMPLPGSMRYPGPPPSPEYRRMQPGAPQPALQPPPAPQHRHVEQLPVPAFVPQEMRIHVQRVIAIPPPHHDQSPQQQGNSDEMQMEQIAMPLPLGGLGGLAALGLTPADLRAIQRTVQEAAAARQRQEQQESIDNDMQEVKTIVNTLEAEARAEEQESQEMHQHMEEEQRAQAQAAAIQAQAQAAQAQAQAHAQAQAQAHAQAEMQAQAAAQAAAAQQAQHAQEMEVLRQEDLAGQEMMGRRAYGRGLPVHIPVPMMVEETQTQQMVPEEGDARPHYVMPRSV